jgi:hypothetical protein
MFGFSDGIDHSQFMAVVMVTESWRTSIRNGGLALMFA